MTKNDRLIFGMLLGGICMFIVMTILSLSDSNKKKKQDITNIARKSDALKTAPLHHRLIFENDSIRIIELILLPGQETPPHNHPAGISWVTVNSSIQVTSLSPAPTPLVIKIDTITLRPDQVNVSFEEPAVQLHRVKNIGDAEYHQFRVEFK